MVIYTRCRCGLSSSGRAPPCQGGGSEFEPRRPLQKTCCKCNGFFLYHAGMVELADTQDLGSCGRPCRFKSCYPHHVGVHSARIGKGRRENACLFLICAPCLLLPKSDPLRRAPILLFSKSRKPDRAFSDCLTVQNVIKYFKIACSVMLALPNGDRQRDYSRTERIY